MKNKIATDIKFIPVRNEKRGHLGFCNFTFEGGMAIKDVAVYRRADGKGVRLVYPEVATLVEGEKRSVVFPINKATQEQIDKEVNEFLINREIEQEAV